MTVRTHHDGIAMLCNSSFELGTGVEDFDRVLRSMLKGAAAVTKRIRPDAGVVTSHLSKPGTAVVLDYFRPAGGYHPRWHRDRIIGHYTLLKDYDPASRSLESVNDNSAETVTRITERDLMERLRFHRWSNDSCATVWLLRKLR